MSEDKKNETVARLAKYTQELAQALDILPGACIDGAVAALKMEAEAWAIAKVMTTILPLVLGETHNVKIKADDDMCHIRNGVLDLLEENGGLTDVEVAIVRETIDQVVMEVAQAKVKPQEQPDEEKPSFADAIDDLRVAMNEHDQKKSSQEIPANRANPQTTPDEVSTTA